MGCRRLAVQPTSKGKQMTIDLRTGLSREYRREDYITKIAGIHIDRDCPTPIWSRFLNRVTAGDIDLQAYFKRVAGYCMTGVTTEHALFFFYGTGSNGKGVFLNTIRGVWGDYATTAPMGMLMESKNERHPTELARLVGVRLVIAQEIERNHRWAESKIKAMTGGDNITAHFMRQDDFEFTPKFKLMIAGNHKPSLSSVDHAIRRRLHLIPFTVTIPESECDRNLPEKLKTEWPGILAWATEGCLEWQKLGLAPPAIVREASEAHFAEEDILGRWIEERCAVDKSYSALLANLFEDWKLWTETSRESTGSQKSFSQNLVDKGFKRGRQGGTGQKLFFGLALRP
jgi:P4 family phage/plasmid primase-like protien